MTAISTSVKTGATSNYIRRVILYIAVGSCLKMWELVRIAVLSISGTLVFIHVVKNFFGGGYCAHSKEKLDGKVIIVTGANSGIGKETARYLAARGAEVILACRDRVEGRQAVREIKRKTLNRSVRFEKLDLSSFESIFDFVNRFRLRGSELHGLCNNAGVFHVPYQLTEDGFDLTLQTNYLGPFLLTFLLLDILKESAPSRIVNVNSEAHTFPKSLDVGTLTKHYTEEDQYDKFLAYGTSKLCLLLFSSKLAKLLAGTGVIVNSANPGNVRTNIFRHFPVIRDLPAWSFSRFLVWLTFKNPAQGAQTSVYLLTSPQVFVTGRYFSKCSEDKPSGLAKSLELEEELWEATLEWLRPFLEKHGIM
ncbi:retinol dehydrogenase 12-like isoform X1 [Homalodisca vitripennis]|uniref:retinol dehydrogenase 12-like isoform X1 n=2 Tax=Homalodisca vitripennis TaxID=197043 RepID=UPI001EEBC3F9|nr:retinol dehydrogenase 12-like isoform X1 [Homalodisca vitripennis]